jgi:hypothetical protein
LPLVALALLEVVFIFIVVLVMLTFLLFVSLSCAPVAPRARWLHSPLERMPNQSLVPTRLPPQGERVLSKSRNM